jgi:hypothetical protein
MTRGLDRMAVQVIECGHSRKSLLRWRDLIFGSSIIESLFQPVPKGAWLAIAGTHNG